MVHDPQQNKKQPKGAGSLLFFIVAILVMAIGAILELIQHLSPVDMGSSVLFFFLIGLLIGLAFRFRSSLH
ncbi:MAG: hypothetical protein ACK2T4_06905 [Candidatus Promineifilaceae bacterium]|jgi:hypothetical protein